MACWPANTVGAFFLALLIYDLIQKEYDNLPYHAIIGVILTGIYWLLCVIGGEGVSGGALIVPVIFAGVFLFTVWFTGESMKKRGCCMTCKGDKQPEPKSCKAILVKKTISDTTSSTSSTSLQEKSTCVDFNLNANQVL